MQTLQEENASLKAAADMAPTTGKLMELEKQISKPPVCAYAVVLFIYDQNMCEHSRQSQQALKLVHKYNEFIDVGSS